MFKWFRILVVLIGLCLIALRLIIAPEYVKINDIKMKYTPFRYISLGEFIRDNTKDWDKNILRDKTFNEQPMDTRLRVAKNYYFRNVASKPDVSHQSKEIKDKLEAYFYETAQVIDEATFREIFPEYDVLSNEEVKVKLFDRFYKKEMSFDEFDNLFSKRNYRLTDKERQIIVKVSGPHNELMPSKDIATIIIHSLGIVVFVGIISYLLIVVERNRKSSQRV